MRILGILMRGMVKAHIGSFKLVFSWMLLCLLLGHSPNVNAQDIRVHYQYFNESDGLEEHRTNTMLRHSNGFLYAGTWNGTYQFDGYEFTPLPFTNREYKIHSHTGAYVAQLGELSNGKVVSIYGKTIDGSTYIDLYDPITKELSTMEIDSVNLDQKVIFHDEQMLSYSNPLADYHRFEEDLQDTHGNELMLSNTLNGRVTLQLNDGRQVELGDLWNSNQIVWRGVYSEDFSKEIFLTSHSGLLRIDIERSNFRTYLSEGAKDWEYGISGRAIAFQDTSKVIFSSTQKGLVTYDRETKQIREISLQDEQTREFTKIVTARAMFVDGDSVLWYPDIHGYLQKIDLATMTSKSVLPDRLVKLITAARNAEGDFFLAHYYHIEGDRGPLENKFVMLNHQTLEVTTYPRLTEFFSTSFHRVTQVMFAEDGTLWYGTTIGLYQIDLAKETIIQEFYATDQYEAAHVDEFEARQNFVLSGQGILALHEDKAGHIWVGLDGGGLNILDPASAKCTVYTKENGLAGNKVCSIEQHESGYWIGTYTGLSHFNRDQNTWRTFDTKNGLPHDEMNRFSSALSPWGEMFFGGMNGYFSFYPQEVLKEDENVRMLLSEASYYDQDEGAVVRYSHNQSANPFYKIPSDKRSCSFKLSMSNMRNPGKHNYIYKLLKDGEEDLADWQLAGPDRTIRYEHLPAGDYQIIAQGTTSTGTPVPPMTIHLEVQEYFYKTWWFILLCVSVCVGLAFVFYKVKVNQVIREERLRTQLSSDLHDDVGSVLSGVAYQMELLAHTVDEQQKDLAMQVAESSRKAMYQMRDVVWAIDSRNGKGIDLAERMKEFAREHLEVNNIDCHFKIADIFSNREISSEIRHSLLLIFKEFGTNTIKHARASNVFVELTLTNKTLMMKCRDDGKGLDGAASTGQGMRNMQMRSQKLNGTFKTYNDSGLTIQIEIPL